MSIIKMITGVALCCFCFIIQVAGQHTFSTTYSFNGSGLSEAFGIISSKDSSYIVYSDFGDVTVDSFLPFGLHLVEINSYGEIVHDNLINFDDKAIIPGLRRNGIFRIDDQLQTVGTVGDERKVTFFDIDDNLELRSQVTIEPFKNIFLWSTHIINRDSIILCGSQQNVAWVGMVSLDGTVHFQKTLPDLGQSELRDIVVDNNQVICSGFSNQTGSASNTEAKSIINSLDFKGNQMYRRKFDFDLGWEVGYLNKLQEGFLFYGLKDPDKSGLNQNNLGFQAYLNQTFEIMVYKDINIGSSEALLVAPYVCIDVQSRSQTFSGVKFFNVDESIFKTAWLYQTDHIGNMLWERHLFENTEQRNGLNDGYRKSDNGFILCGETYDTLNRFQGFRSWVVSTDSLGCIEPECDTLCPRPYAISFDTISVTSDSFSFMGYSTNATAYRWNFGDGQDRESFIENPGHKWLASGRYEVCLNAKNSCGSRTYCDSVSVIADTTNNIAEPLFTPEFTLSPNPSKDLFRVTFQDINEATRLEVYDLNGQILRTMPVFPYDQTITIYLEDCSTGVYLVKLMDKHGRSVVQELVVQ